MLAAAALAGVAALARALGDRRPRVTAARAGAPFTAAWCLILALLLSSQANHYFANWSRLRAAALTLLWLAVAAFFLIALLSLLERHCRICSRLVARVGAPALVFASAFLVYLASAGGHLYTPDEWSLYAVAAGLVQHGVPAMYADEPYPLHHLASVYHESERRPDDSFPRAFSKYGIVPSLIAAPLYALARLTGPGPDLPRDAFPFENRALPLVPLLQGSAITAAVAALLFLTARGLNYARRPALLAAFAFAFGSLAWPYAKTLMNMSLAAGLLLASFWCVLRSRATSGNAGHPNRWLLAAGVAAGLACATRYETILFAVPIAVLAALRPRPPSGLALQALLRYLAGAALAVLPLVFGLNLLRSGSLLETGYGGEGLLATLDEKPWYALYGILFSPGCGLVAYTPLMALGIIALIWLWEDAPRPALAAGAIVLLALLYYGTFKTWCGSLTWGPRYLLVVAPFMALPLASLWQRLARPTANPFAILVIGGLALWSAATNLLAVFVDFNRGWQDHWANDLSPIQVTWMPYFTGVVTHWRLLREWLLDGRGGLDLYLLYAPGPSAPVGIAVELLLLAAALTCLTATWLANLDHPPYGGANPLSLWESGGPSGGWAAGEGAYSRGVSRDPRPPVGRPGSPAGVGRRGY